MNVFTVIFGLASVFSLVLALLIRRADVANRIREDVNRRVLRERLRSAGLVLRAANTNAELLLRATLSEDFSASEAQAFARAIRSDLVAGVHVVETTTEALDDWRFGGLLQSTDPARPPSRLRPPPER
jgi:hypothetical protein